MNKAVIFDMDGVIVNSEFIWEKYEKKFLPELVGRRTYFRIKDEILGRSVGNIYEIASRNGLQMSKKHFEQVCDKYAKIVYRKAKITNGIKNLLEKLMTMNFKLGLVSSSRKNWVDKVLDKLNSSIKFDFVLSLDERLDIRPKPFPDGYKQAIKTLESKPDVTIIIEDSERGIKAAKGSGALTVCLRENLAKDYKPKGADIYAGTVKELIEMEVFETYASNN